MVYRTSKTLWIVFGGLVLAMEIMLFTAENQHVAKTDIEFILLAAFWPLLFAFIAFGQYVRVTNDEIVLVEYFFKKKRIAFERIQSLSYVPNGRLGTIARSLYVVPQGMQRQKEVVEVSNVHFSEPTIAAIAQALREAAKSVTMDTTVDQLIEKFKVKRTARDLWRESWGENRPQTIGSVGIITCLAIFFFGLYLQDSGVEMNGAAVLIFPVSMTAALFFVGYTIHGTIKNALWYLLPTLLFFAWIALSPAPTVYTYTCENGSQFNASFPPNGQMRIILNADNTEARMIPAIETPDTTRAYDDGTTAYTFVAGYDGQLIVTDKSGPFSTICHGRSSE